MKITVGTIVTTHGIKGNLKIKNLSDNDKRFTDGSKVFIDDTLLTVENSFDQKGLKIIKFYDYNDINDVLKFVGKDITIDEKDLITLEDDEFYIYKLIGLDVYSNGQKKGKIEDVISGVYPNDVYVIKLDTNNEVLVPALASVIKNVDIENSIIEIENLIDYE